jgi:hypothetical protein
LKARGGAEGCRERNRATRAGFVVARRQRDPPRSPQRALSRNCSGVDDRAPERTRYVRLHPRSAFDSNNRRHDLARSSNCPRIWSVRMFCAAHLISSAISSYRSAVGCCFSPIAARARVSRYPAFCRDACQIKYAEPYYRGSVRGFMDDPSTLRRKAAQFFQKAAFSASVTEAEKLNQVGRQLELWAEDLEEITAREQQSRARRERRP